MKKSIVFLLIMLLATSFVFAQGAKEATDAADAPLKVGVIYISPPGDMGYSYMHDQGTIAMEEHFGDKVEVIRMEGIPENESSERVMESLIDEGCKIIWLCFRSVWVNT